VATTRPRRRAPDPGVDDDDQGSGAELVNPENRAILHHALEEAARLLRSDGAMAYFQDPATGILRYADDAGITDDRRRRWVRGLKVEPGVGLFGRAVAERRTQLTGDYANDPSFVHFPGADRLVETLAIRSFLVAPLLAGDRIFGAMGTYSGRPDAFDEHDVALVRALADHAAAAMANAELIEQLAGSRAELERRVDAERALREIGARITAVRDPTEVLQLAVDEAAGLLGADGARITAVRDPTEVLQLAVDEAAGLLGADGARIDLLHDDGALYWAYDATTGRRPGLGPIGGSGEAKAGEGISGRAVRELQAVFTGDYLNDDRFEHAELPDAHVKKYAIRSVVAVPLLGDRGPLGTLTVYTGTIDAFSEADARLLEALAGQAAIALTNAGLIERLAASQAEERRRATAEQALRQIATRITAITDPTELLQQVTDAGRKLLNGERSQLDIVDPATGLIRWTTASGDGLFGTALPGTTQGTAAGVGINGAAIDAGGVVITGDYLNDERIHHIPASDGFVALTGIRSVVAAPLMSDTDLLGVLKVATTRQDAWDDEDAALMAAFADQVVVAIQNARLIDELGRSREEISRRADAEKSVREIAADISALRDVAAILQQTVDEARRLLASNSARIDMLDEDGETLRWAYASGEDAVRTRDTGFDGEFKVGEGIAGLTVQSGEAFRTGDYLADDRFTHVPRSDALVEETGFRSVLSAPLRGETGPLGAISVSSELPDHYDDNQSGLLQALADQAAIAIQNARLIEELNRSRREVGRRAAAEQSLREIAARITAIRETHELLQHVADEAARLLDSEGAIIDLLDPISGSIAVGYVAGLDPDRTQRWEGSRVGEDIVRRALAGRTALFTIDYLDDERFTVDAEAADVARGLGLRSIAIAPLVSERGALGTIAVFSPEPGRFGEDHANLLGALADQAAIALLNARLIDELERSQGELEARAETERSLRDISARITSLGDPGEILARVVEESRRLLHSDGAHLTRMSEDGTYLVPVIVAGGMDGATESWLKELTFPLGGGINGLAAEEIRPIWTYDYPVDPRIPHEPGDDEAASRLGLRAMAAAPLRAPAGEVIGTLAISYAEPREILPDELDLLQGLADQAAIALTNSNLYELLGESEARYRHLVQNSPDLVWSIDAEARFSFVSDTCQRLTGWRADEVLGRHFGSLVHPSSREVAEIDWTAGLGEVVAGGGRELRGRVNLLHRDGHPVPAEFIAFATRDEAGVFAGANGSVRDMSERERLERELRESEERFRFLIENSPDIIFAVDAGGRFTYVSETVRRSLGREPEEMVGQPFGDMIAYAPGDEAGMRFGLMRDDPDLEITNRLTLRHADGRLLPFEVSSVGVRQDGVFAGVQGAARDISERERLERDLRRQAGELASSQERAHLARELHDSVTQALFSMTLVTRSVELLIDRDPAIAKEKLTSLRDLQREALAEMRALIFELRPGNLENDGLLAALRTHTAALQGRIGLPVVVTSELSERLPLEVEEVLYRIAQEALHNVVKHAAARQVEVAVDRRGPDVVLRIRDDGKGFDAALVPDGHLGLTGMRARADKIGATYSVMSRTGEGTTVEVVVPPEAIVRAAGAAAAGESTGSPAIGGMT
jgi:PAS domain S-box-containing protein